MNHDRDTIKWLWGQTRSLHKRMLLLLAGNIVFAASSVWFALLCRRVIDAAVESRLREAVKAGLFLLGLIVLQFAMRILLNSTEEYIRSSLGKNLRSDRLHELLKKTYSSVQNRHSGDFMNRFFSDVRIVADGVASLLPKLCSMLTRLICAIAVLVLLEPIFAVVFVVVGICLIVTTGIFRKRMKVLHKDVQEKQGRVQAFLQEIIGNLLIVRVFRYETAAEERNEELQQAHFQAQMKRRKIAIAANAGFSLVFRLGYLFALCWGVRGLYEGSMTYGTLTAILQLVGQIQGPVVNLSGLLPQYYGIIASAERLMEMNTWEDESEEQDRAGCRTLQSIDCSHVSFSYGRTEVLKNVSFQIKAGDIVALTGLSGGGKSTIFLLLLGIYRPLEGTIQITADGKKVLPGRAARTLFTYVPQENGLFSGTIRDNLLMARPDASQEDLTEALRIACADEFVKALPEGLETYLGERGNGFSEGQRQRIAIARAVLSEAPVILLDEATSALDGATEGKVLEHIAALSNRTCLIVTHREAALRICNQQIVLADGRTSSQVRRGEDAFSGKLS